MSADHGGRLGRCGLWAVRTGKGMSLFGWADGPGLTPQKYLMPHLQPPSSTSFQQTSSALTEQFDEAQRLLNELQAQTTTLQSSIESDRERVGSVVEEVEQALQSVRDGEEKWREEMRDVRSEVESVRDLVPKVSKNPLVWSDR